MKAFCILFLTVFMALPVSGLCQAITEPSYDLDLLAAKYAGDTKEIMLVFKYSPKAQKVFKPIFSAKIGYSLGGGEEKTELMDRSKHRMEFFGRDIDRKSPLIYSLIKDKVDLTQEAEFGIVVFHLKELVQSYVGTMTFTYGLWEPENDKIRLERTYEIAVAR